MGSQQGVAYVAKKIENYQWVLSTVLYPARHIISHFRDFHLHWYWQTGDQTQNKQNIVTLFAINRHKKTEKTQKSLVSKSMIKMEVTKG